MKKNCISNKQLREFGILVGIGIPFIFGWLFPVIFGHDLRLWTTIVGFPILIIGIFKPIILFYPYKYWMNFGFILGWINSRLILGLVYLLVLLPIAIIMKFFSYDPLRIKNNNNNSYREDKSNYVIHLNKIF